VSRGPVSDALGVESGPLLRRAGPAGWWGSRGAATGAWVAFMARRSEPAVRLPPVLSNSRAADRGGQAGGRARRPHRPAAAIRGTSRPGAPGARPTGARSRLTLRYGALASAAFLVRRRKPGREVSGRADVLTPSRPGRQAAAGPIGPPAVRPWASRPGCTALVSPTPTRGTLGYGLPRAGRVPGAETEARPRGGGRSLGRGLPTGVGRWAAELVGRRRRHRSPARDTCPGVRCPPVGVRSRGGPGSGVPRPRSMAPRDRSW
jgi:hypothetical protein